jgi:hypothetical protein
VRRSAALATLSAVLASCWYEVLEPESASSADASASSASPGAGGHAGAGGVAGEGGAARGGAGGQVGAGGSMPVGEFTECQELDFAGGCFGNQLLVYFDDGIHPCSNGSMHCFLNRCAPNSCELKTCGGAPDTECSPAVTPYIDCATEVSVSGDCFDGVAVRKSGASSCIIKDCSALPGAKCRESPEVLQADCYAP